MTEDKTEDKKLQWRKKCYLLTQIDPSAFVVKIVTKKELENLLWNNYLSTTPQDIVVKKYYFFYHEKYIYGIFKPVSFKNNRVFFNNLTQYKNPLRLWGIHHDKVKLKAAFEQKTRLMSMLEKENFSAKTLMISIKKSDNGISICAASQSMEKLIHHFSVVDPQKLERIESIFEEIKNIFDQESHYQEEKNFFYLLSLGSKIADILFQDSHLLKIIRNFNTIKLNNATFLPIYAWHYVQQKDDHQENIFPFIRSKTMHHYHNEKAHHIPKKNYHQSSVINSFAVVDLINDSLSQLEMNTIKKSQMLCIKKEMPVSYLNGEMHDLKNVFANNDFVHLIANGKEMNENLFFCDKNDEILPNQDLKHFSKMPKVLFLSVCFSENAPIIEHFFQNGGKTLIVSAGRLSTRELHYYISTFYWQLFSARHSIITAFHSMIYKFFNNKKINAFRLRLYGEGKEIFVGKRDFGENPLQMTSEDKNDCY